MRTHTYFMADILNLFITLGLNPDPHNLPKLDPKDAFLLADPSSSTGVFANGSSTPASGTQLAPVAWLRKTEYISRESSQRSSLQEAYVLFRSHPQPQKFNIFHRKHIASATVDVSRNAQLRDVEASFVACNENFSLEKLVHPNKPNVTAIESYPVLPDADIWANQYDLFRFSERPGDRPVDVRPLFKCAVLNLFLYQVDDPRLDCAILRPMKTEHDSFLAFYLTPDDESAIQFKETRFGLAPYEVAENQEVSMDDYNLSNSIAHKRI